MIMGLCVDIYKPSGSSPDHDVSILKAVSGRLETLGEWSLMSCSIWIWKELWFGLEDVTYKHFDGKVIFWDFALCAA